MPEQKSKKMERLKAELLIRKLLDMAYSEKEIKDQTQDKTPEQILGKNMSDIITKYIAKIYRQEGDFETIHVGHLAEKIEEKFRFHSGISRIAINDAIKQLINDFVDEARNDPKPVKKSKKKL